MSTQYLNDIEALVQRVHEAGQTKHDLLRHDIEEFGRSRIPLSGMVQQFHQSNLLYLWEKARLRRRQERELAVA